MPSLQNSNLRARHPREAQDPFDFPPDQHLLITTPSRVFSWDASGLQTLFKSSKSGIAAAAESNDGSGILAGLTAEEDEVRHLSYTADSKKLYLSTKVTNAVQCYSTEGQRLLSPPEVLASSPVVLAVSPNGGLMVTAERDPPSVYLKYLRGTTPSTMVVLQSSGTGVAVTAFHPDRPEVFLLGFEDGTLAVIDVSRLANVANDGLYADQKRVGKAELGRIRNLHKSTTSRSRSRDKSITGAAFLPDRALRVISVGADGRCRLSDFSGKPTILWTWHCKVSLACIAVSCTKKSTSQPPLHGEISEHLTPYSPSALIAIGSEHGSVMLYDSLGLLKHHSRVGRKGQRLISVEWIQGPSPGLSSRIVPRETSVLLGIPPGSICEPRKQTAQHDGTGDPHFLGVHPALRPPATAIAPPSTRKFTIHPDEECTMGTVRRAPPQPGALIASPAVPANRDLFSTTLKPWPAELGGRNPRLRSAPISRPRISTNTFAKRIVSTSRKKPTISWPIDMELSARESHATSSISLTSKRDGNDEPLPHHAGVAARARAKKLDGSSRHGLPPEPAPISTRPRTRTNVRSPSTPRSPKGAPTSGQVREGSAGHTQITRPQFAPIACSKPLTMPPQPVLSPPRPPVESRVYGRGGRWVSDSVSEDSWFVLHENELWLTSDDEQAHITARQHHLFRRPPTHQTSRSHAGLQGVQLPVQVFSGHSVYPEHDPLSSQAVPMRAKTRRAKTFAPDSDHVRRLFPRTSSLSRDRKGKGKSARPRKSVQQHLAPQLTSSAIAGHNTTGEGRMHAKSTKNFPGDCIESRERSGELHEASNCCVESAARTRALEGELSALKLELAAVKPALLSHAAAGKYLPKQHHRSGREDKMRRP
nr:hypothetical protein B0A51_10174 [Rachicladosporium sp. CCFEE 5018]